MTLRLPRRIVPTLALAGLATLLMASTAAADPLVFVTAFAPGAKGGIHAFQWDQKSGALKAARRTEGVENPFFLALSRDGKFLYSIHSKEFGGKEADQVAAYAISGREGELKLLNRQSAKGRAACYLDVDATGKAVVVANYSSGSVASLPVKADGSLAEAASFFEHKGASVDSSRQKESHAHCFVFSPDNRFAYAADLGLDQVLCYKLDPATAQLTKNEPPFATTPPGAGPRHLTFHPNGKWIYVINELANSVTAFDYDATSGALKQRATISTVPADFKEKSYCADLKITPNGKFLYGTNRGHDSVAMYRIGDDGALSLVGIEPSLGKGPQNLAISPSGDFLLCANMPGNNVVLFKIDAASGKLKAEGKPIEITSPSCIMVLK